MESGKREQGVELLGDTLHFLNRIFLIVCNEALFVICKYRYIRICQFLHIP